MLKVVCKFVFELGHKFIWTKLVWSRSIPPSRGFILWCMIHNRMPMDEILWTHGYVVVSMSSLCGSVEETSYHLFLRCSFVNNLSMRLQKYCQH